MTAPTTALAALMEAAYEDIKTLAYVAGCGSLISLVWLLVIILRKRHAKQKHYLLLYIWILVLGFIMAVLLSMFCHSISTEYNTTRELFNAGAACVTSPGWAALPLKMYTDSLMNHSWAVAFLALLLLGLLVGVCVLYSVMRRIGNMKRPQSTHSYQGVQ